MLSLHPGGCELARTRVGERRGFVGTFTVFALTLEKGRGRVDGEHGSGGKHGRVDGEAEGFELSHTKRFNPLGLKSHSE